MNLTVLTKLDTSAFRRRFHLKEKEKQYIAQKGIETIRRHTVDFIKNRLACADIPNDGKQTPVRKKSVFFSRAG